MMLILFQNYFSLDPNDLHPIIIGVILILEHATLLYSSHLEKYLALDQAKSQYLYLIHACIIKQFFAPSQNYSDAEFLQFILHNRLPSK